MKMERLLGAILLKAVQDWENPEFQADVEEFVHSDWFVDLVEALELKPESIREQFMSHGYQRVDIRAAYR
jgi:hypothetical protein